MLENHFGKIIIIILVIILSIFASMFYSSNQKHQDYLEQEIQTLKVQVAEQDSTIEINNKQLLEESQRQAQQQAAKQLNTEKQLLDKQAEIDKIQLANQQQLIQLKEQQLDEKLDKIETVVTVLEQQQQQEKELRAHHLKMSQAALTASYLTQGLQTASMLKVQVAEFYMSEGQFPNSNQQLRLPPANSYATDTIKSVGVSKDGKIIVVYQQVTGQEHGAISLIPKYKNGQLNWQCTTSDFKNVQQFIPQCKYSLAQ
jgi:membrane-associated HD superfamily phosphohydrolase